MRESKMGGGSFFKKLTFQYSSTSFFFICLIRKAFHNNIMPTEALNITTNMLAISSKKTERIIWTPYLREYISNGYAEHPDLYTDDFRVLDELRNDCIYMETNQKALNRLIK